MMGYPFPQGELELIDMTVRMFTEPKLVGDSAVFAEVWRDEEARKAELLGELGYDVSTEEGWALAERDLQSADRFTQLLEGLGVEVEYKEGKHQLIPAFAKNDEFMKELLNHDDDRISNLAAARVGIKSTALQTRAATLGWMSSRGELCVYLRYCAAGTTRWGGGDGSNFQNLKRGHKIRTALTSPNGFLLGTPDASQIECRLLNTLAGQWDVVEKFRNNEDPYAALATAFYGEPVYKPAKDDPRASELEAKRGTGKQGELSCGYGCGGPKFKATAAAGTYGPSVKMPLDDAQRFVDTYRFTHPAICDRRNPHSYWSQGGEVIKCLHAGAEMQWGPSCIKDHRIWLPNGTPLIYDTLEWYTDTNPESRFYGQQEWRVRSRDGWQKMYDAKMVENHIQALARVKMADDMKVIRKEGLDIVGMSHDEAWVLIPEGLGAEDDLQFCLDVLSSPPWWLPDVPLGAEGKMGKRYSK